MVRESNRANGRASFSLGCTPTLAALRQIRPKDFILYTLPRHVHRAFPAFAKTRSRRLPPHACLSHPSLARTAPPKLAAKQLAPMSGSVRAREVGAALLPLAHDARKQPPRQRSAHLCVQLAKHAPLLATHALPQEPARERGAARVSGDAAPAALLAAGHGRHQSSGARAAA